MVVVYNQNQVTHLSFVICQTISDLGFCEKFVDACAASHWVRWLPFGFSEEVPANKAFQDGFWIAEKEQDFKGSEPPFFRGYYLANRGLHPTPHNFSLFQQM